MARNKRNADTSSNSRGDLDTHKGKVDRTLYEEEMEDPRGRTSSNDNPGLVTTSLALTGSNNYLAWKNSLVRALTAKDKLNYILDEEKDPEEGTIEF